MQKSTAQTAQTAQTTKIISWNVNGIRSNVLSPPGGRYSGRGPLVIDQTSNFAKMIAQYEPDIVCLQETRCAAQVFDVIVDSIGPDRGEYFPYRYVNPSTRTERGRGSGYSGTAIFSKQKPLAVTMGLPTLDEPNLEGRCITAEYGEMFIVTAYTPNSGTNEEYRIQQWDPAMAQHLHQLKETGKKVVFVGDMNVCHREIDIFSGFPSESARIAGLLPEERQGFERFIDDGFVDSYRMLHPDEDEAFTWWNQRIKQFRADNKGWRLDYALVGMNGSASTEIHSAECLINVHGSDHCPIFVEV